MNNIEIQNLRKWHQLWPWLIFISLFSSFFLQNISYVSVIGWGVLCLGFCILLRAYLTQKKTSLLMLLLPCCVVASMCFRFGVSQAEDTNLHVKNWSQTEDVLVKIRGDIVSTWQLNTRSGSALSDYTWQPEISYNSRLKVREIWVDGQWQAAKGQLYILSSDQTLSQGHIEAIGWVLAPQVPLNPVDADPNLWLSALGCDASMRIASSVTMGQVSGLHHTRMAIQQRAQSALTYGMKQDSLQEKQALSLLLAVVLGQKNSVYDDVKQVFRDLGCAHVLAISGAHISLMVMMLVVLLRYLKTSPRMISVAVLLILGVYLLVVPWRPPVLRASFCVAFVFIIYGLGRHMSGLATLSLAAWVLLWMRPADISNIGFHLSFIATACLIVFLRKYTYYYVPKNPLKMIDVWWRILLRWVMGLWLMGLLAWLILAPWLIYYFGTLPWANIGLSVAVAPVLIVLLALGFVKLCLGMIWPPLGLPIAFVLDFCLLTAWQAMQWFDQWLGHPLIAKRDVGFIWLIVTQLCTWCLLWIWIHKDMRMHTRWAVCTVVVACLSYVFVPAQHDKHQGFTATIFAVDDGSAILLQSDEHTVLYDAGSRYDSQIGTRVIVPNLQAMGIHELDALIVSHADFDHYCAILDIVDNLAVTKIYISENVQQAVDADVAALSYIAQQLALKGMRWQTLSAGDILAYGDLTGQVLWPKEGYVAKEDNQASVCIDWCHPQGRMLCLGDLQEQALNDLMVYWQTHQLGHVDAIEMPHHGTSLHDLTEDFLTCFQPQILLQSAGKKRGLLGDWQTAMPRWRQQTFGQWGWTARDGMLTVEFDHDKGPVLRRFVE